MSASFRIRNWDQYQHYSNRNPPWVKLYYDLLTSRDWVGSDDASRVLMVACILIASRNGGEIPDDPDFVKRVAYLNSEPNFEPLVECGFLVAPEGRASKPAKDASTSPSVSEKSVSEKEKSPETKAKGYTVDFDRFWKEYPAHKTRKHDAWKAWRLTTSVRPPVNELIAKIHDLLAHDRKWRQGYIPHASKWLRGHGWEDEIETGKNGGAPMQTGKKAEDAEVYDQKWGF